MAADSGSPAGAASPSVTPNQLLLQQKCDAAILTLSLAVIAGREGELREAKRLLNESIAALVNDARKSSSPAGRGDEDSVPLTRAAFAELGVRYGKNPDGWRVEADPGAIFPQAVDALAQAFRLRAAPRSSETAPPQSVQERFGDIANGRDEAAARQLSERAIVCVYCETVIGHYTDASQRPALVEAAKEHDAHCAKGYGDRALRAAAIVPADPSPSTNQLEASPQAAPQLSEETAEEAVRMFFVEARWNERKMLRSRAEVLAMQSVLALHAKPQASVNSESSSPAADSPAAPAQTQQEAQAASLQLPDGLHFVQDIRAGGVARYRLGQHYLDLQVDQAATIRTILAAALRVERSEALTNEDSARLDWLDKWATRIKLTDSGVYEFAWVDGDGNEFEWTEEELYEKYENIRKTIDAARAASRGDTPK